MPDVNGFVAGSRGAAGGLIFRARRVYLPGMPTPAVSPEGVARAARRWVFPAAPEAAAVERLRAELRLPEPLCRLLAQRGISRADAAKDFLRPHAGQFHAPQGLAGMAEAVARLRRALERGETILVHGDYDVDGICSTALYVRALRRMGGRAEPFVPHRLVDGYDLSDAGVRAAAEAGATLILTGDCGIVAHGAVERARSHGDRRRGHRPPHPGSDPPRRGGGGEPEPAATAATRTRGWPASGWRTRCAARSRRSSASPWSSSPPTWTWWPWPPWPTWRR